MHPSNILVANQRLHKPLNMTPGRVPKALVLCRVSLHLSYVCPSCEQRHSRSCIRPCLTWGLLMDNVNILSSLFQICFLFLALIHRNNAYLLLLSEKLFLPPLPLLYMSLVPGTFLSDKDSIPILLHVYKETNILYYKPLRNLNMLCFHFFHSFYVK